MLGLYVKVRNFLSSEKGQGMVEYALIIGLIAIALVIVLGTMSGSIQDIFERISNALNNAGVQDPTAGG